MNFFVYLPGNHQFFCSQNLLALQQTAVIGAGRPVTDLHRQLVFVWGSLIKIGRDGTSLFAVQVE